MLYLLPVQFDIHAGKSRSGKTPLELFLAGVSHWDAGNTKGVRNEWHCLKWRLILRRACGN
jgi:hypothetical protein